jgi:hypothetical protein
MLGDAFQADVDAAINTSAALPPAPPKIEQRSAWGAIPRGIAAGAARVGAAVLDSAAAVPEDPFEKRRRDSAGIPTPDTAGTAKRLREFDRGLRPDPATASTAEQVLFGVSAVLTEIVPATVVFGPLGGALVGGTAEGMSTADDLAREGVDKSTRTKVGALTGALTAAGAVLPMAGPTLKATAGLYLAGGPGAYVAQQMATRKVLEAADYAGLAKQYDPLDPLGLAMSALIPLPFAAHGAVRNVRAMRGAPTAAPAPAAPAAPAVPRETVDAAMVHNLTLQRDVHEAHTAEVLPRAGEVSRVQSLAEFAAERGVKPAKAAAEGPDPFLVWLRDQGGVSSAEKFDITGERAGLSRGAIFKRDGLGLDELARRAEADGFLPPGTVEDAADNGGTRALAELVQRAAGGERIRTVMDQMQFDVAERARADMADRVQGLENRLKLLGEDPTPALGDLTTLEAYLARHEERLIGARMADIAEQQRLLDAEPAEPMRLRPPKEDPPELAEVRQAVEDMADSGRSMPDYLDGAAGLSPAARNLLVGLFEAGGDKAKGTKLLGDFSRTREARPSASPADVAADVVEAARAGREVTPEAATPEKKAAGHPLAELVSSRLQALEQEAGDMVVRLDEEGRPVTMAEELARVRKEAAEGVGDELGALDADLVKVAAECALATGSA